MPRSRLRWRALAVLGALLSVMIDWPIGFAMPAINNQHIQIMTKIHPCTSAGSRNCSAAYYLNLTNSDRVTDRGGDQSNSSDSSSAESPNSDSKSSPKHDQDSLMTMLSPQSTIDQRIIANSNRSIRPDRLMRIYNKRKRKKSVARLTADQLRSIRTHNLSSSSDVNNLIDINNNNNNLSENQINSSSESNILSNSATEIVTDESLAAATVHSIVDNTTVSRYLSRTDRSVKLTLQNNQRKVNDSNLDRNERSANLSHSSGPAKKIQLFIKNRYIQVLPDGTINGTQDDLSDYTILQRTTVDVGQIKIQGVATCLFLCMDQCGAVYGSKSFTDDCVFNESMGQHHYNSYSSTYNSNSRTLYLGLDRYGVPRKVIIPRTRSLEKLATYTKAMTADVQQDRVEKLIARTFGANRVKHGLRQLCDAGKPLIELTASVMRPRPKCNNGQTSSSAPTAQATVSEKLSRLSNNHSSSNNSSISGSHSKPSSNNNGNVRKKKKKRRCRPTENEQEHNCHKPRAQALKKRAQNRKCLQRLQECANARNKKNNGGNGKKQKGANQTGHKKRKLNGPGGGGNSGNGAGGNRKSKTFTSTTPASTTISTTPATTISAEETSTATTQTTITTLRSANAQTNRRKSPPNSNEEEISTEDSQQSSTETHESSDDGEDEDSSISSMGGHAQLVNGDDLLYDDDFDV